MMNMSRFHDNLSQKKYGHVCPAPTWVGELDLEVPKNEQFVIRMLVSLDGGRSIQMPSSLDWILPIVKYGIVHQSKIKTGNSFVYVTVRHGMVATKTDDEWHVDGFSARFPHRPEQNYVWCDKSPTEWWNKKIELPEDFDGLKHNIHWYFQSQIKNNKHIKKVNPKTVYCFDPYVVHRRNPRTKNIKRTFIRVSFLPILVADRNNTFNPHIPLRFCADGVKEFRDNLTRYCP